MSSSSSSTTETTDVEQAVELIVVDASASSDADAVTPSDEIGPLLSQSEKPKINIFSVSYSQRKPRERVTETEISPLSIFVSWVWNGSRYSGFLCMAFSAMIYFIMEVISDVFTVQSIPLFETTFMRCTVILVLSYLWLRKCGQPIFGPAHARNILFSRALIGYLSLLSFIYCIQRLHASQAIVLSFTTPIIASIAAKFVLHEKMKISEVGGLACSFFGVLFISRQILTTQAVSDGFVKAGEASILHVREGHHIFAVLVGFFSSIAGGISYCLIRAGAKASDQPVVTLFSFGILASPAAGLCTFSFEDFQRPSLYSFFLMLVLGVLAFFAQVFLARALQLEKTGRVVNVLYIEAALTHLWGLGSSRIIPSVGRFIGCLFIVLSVCLTMYIGPDKETNEIAYSPVV